MHSPAVARRFRTGRVRRVAVWRASRDGAGGDDVRLVPRRPIPQPNVCLVRRVSRELARARPGQRVERARVRVRGWV